MRMVCGASISGLPQITLPIGAVDGSPIGLSFIGWRNGEEALLALAKKLSGELWG
jgi:amidase